MTDQSPTTAKLLETLQLMSSTYNKMQSAKNPSEVTAIINSLSNEQVGSIRGLVTAGFVLVIGIIEAFRGGMDNDTSMSIEQFSNLFHHSGLTQTELAKALGVTQPNIAAWLNGTRPVPQKHAEKIHQICMKAGAKRLFALCRGGDPTSPGHKKAA